MTSYSRSPRFSIFIAGTFFAGVGMGGFLWPPSLGGSVLTYFSAMRRHKAFGYESTARWLLAADFMPAQSVQILKKYSGIPTMYFRLNNHRSTILIGSAVMQSSKNIMTWY